MLAAPHRFLPVWLALALSSCVGSIQGGGTRAGGETPADPLDPMSTPPPTTGPSRPPQAMKPDPSPPATCTAQAAVWRGSLLTRAQYVNAASDLLGFDVGPLVAFADAGARKAEPGVSLTALQVEERQRTAEAIAAAAASPAHLAGLGCDPAKQGEPACVDNLITGLGTRAFRHPPDAVASAGLRKLFAAGRAAGGFAVGAEWLLAGVLQSPDFLYQLAPAPAGAAGAVVALDDFALASRLSFFLWNSAPDAELLAAAMGGGLRTDEGLGAQVQRLLADPRAARTREDYHALWLRLDDVARVARDAPELTPAFAQALRRSALLGIEAFFQGDARVDSLFGGSTLFVDDVLAKVYGLASPGAQMQAVKSDPQQRHGLLTHPALLTVLAAADTSDPIKRGVFMQEAVLCQTLPDPLPDIPNLPPLRPGLSTRQRLEQHRARPACASCHQLIDPMGLAFESWDAIGRYRTMDQGVPVDSSGEVAQGLDVDGPFANGIELLGRVEKSGTARDCLARNWFEYAVSRDADPAEACALTKLQARFRQSGDVRELLAAIAQADVFRTQRIPQEQAP